MVIDNWEVAMVLYIGPAFKHEPSGKTCQLMARWWHDRLIVSRLDNQEHQAHLFLTELLGETARCPVIDQIEVGIDGIGCTINGSSAKGVRFQMVADSADFVNGWHFTFSLTIL